LRFLIQVVPQGCGPDWSSNIGIEFRREWGGIPEVGTREAIAEVVGFVAGRRLLNVRHSGFDETGTPVDCVAVSPWGHNVRAVCAAYDDPPIQLGDRYGGPFLPEDPARMETALAALVPSYLALRDELGLSDAMWRYRHRSAHRWSGS
jgi:hypothetical protein